MKIRGVMAMKEAIPRRTVRMQQEVFDVLAEAKSGRSYNKWNLKPERSAGHLEGLDRATAESTSMVCHIV